MTAVFEIHISMHIIKDFMFLFTVKVPPCTANFNLKMQWDFQLGSLNESVWDIMESTIQDTRTNWVCAHQWNATHWVNKTAGTPTKLNIPRDKHLCNCEEASRWHNRTGLRQTMSCSKPACSHEWSYNAQSNQELNCHVQSAQTRCRPWGPCQSANRHAPHFPS